MNFLTVTLSEDADIVNENLNEINKIYKVNKLYIVCPQNHKEIFINKLSSKNYEIINEEDLLGFSEFTSIFDELSSNLTYREDFKKRLKWYYALILKFCFIHKFYEENNENLVIWEGDTIILKKIKFFENYKSIPYCYVTYFHKIYFDVCKELLGTLPKYYGSFITQFGSITKGEANFLFKSLNLENLPNKKFNLLFSKKILDAVFKTQSKYDNAMFADYELIGINKLNQTFQKPIPIFFLRPALDGKLTAAQKYFAKLFNVNHITYEHRHPNKHSKDMLLRTQTWIRFIKILPYFYFQFKFYQLKFNFKYYFKLY